MAAVLKLPLATWAAPARAASASPRRTTERDRTLPPSWICGRVVGEGREGIGDGGKGLQLHLDERGGRGGDLPRLGGDRGQHVAHVPDDLALGDEQRPVRPDEALLATAGDIGCGHHRHHARDCARRRRVDGTDERARDAGEAQRPVEHARRYEIAHEGLLAQGQLPALVARPRYGLHASCVTPADGGGQRDRVDDRDIAGAAAQVARQRAGDGLARRGGLAAQECLGLHDDAGRAVAALRGAGGHERIGPEVRDAGPAGPRSSRSRVRPHASAGCAQDTTAWPSTITVHAPHEPSGAQPSFIERRPHRSRRTWSSDSPGSMSSSTVRPFNVKSIGPPCRRQRRTVWPYATALRAWMVGTIGPGLRVPCGPNQLSARASHARCGRRCAEDVHAPAGPRTGHRGRGRARPGRRPLPVARRAAAHLRAARGPGHDPGRRHRAPGRPGPRRSRPAEPVPRPLVQRRLARPAGPPCPSTWSCRSR